MSDFTPSQGDNIDQERSHAFDGITEYDNNLPRWWLWMLYISMAIALFYAYHYHFGSGVLSRQDVDEWIANKPKPPVSEKKSEEELRILSRNPELIAKGQALVPKVLCMTCHGPTFTGLIGPNLTDKYWLYGSSMTDIIESITNGRNVVMPGRAGHNMTDEEILAVACFVADLSRQGEKPGMRPQAAREKEDPITY
jgi:cytochrome c oxidase cbb3-type subunit 3